ncbi:hypothetical protein [Fructobacillus papyrifericola]|uniref:Two-component sensor histidine kinase n=1 Tax=Fructobacillus papyrifericola TaxID=2713172 RepID=A0ABS5QR28_9LACO|nr:hypothetical protein [Fructobacillus papyrifericola]MBS9335653.1 hypothetical protein [Fructobacillus papyrifericola]
MKKGRKRPAYILVPTLLLLVLLTVLYLAQLAFFQMRVQSIRAVTSRQELDVVQIRALADYLESQRAEGKWAGFSYYIDSLNERILIEGKTGQVSRPLLSETLV